MASAAVPSPVIPEPAPPVYYAAVMKKVMKKAKGKKKGKAASKPRLAEGEEAKPKPPSLKQQINDMLADRDVEEVVAEAREAVQTCMKAIDDAEKLVEKSGEDVEAAKRKMDESSHSVEMLVAKESIAYEKLKSARLAQHRATEDTQRAQSGRIEHSTAIVILECEKNAQAAVKDLEEAKKAAHEAFIAAKLKVIEEKTKAKEAQTAIKDTRKEQSEKEKEALACNAEGQIGARAEAKEFAKNAKLAEKEMKSEMNQLAKDRLLRDKERQKILRDALNPKKRSLAIADAAAASPAKATRIQDVD